MTGNQLSYWKLQEEKRSNVARESETQRHNIISEDLDAVNLKLKEQDLEYKGQQLRIDNARALTDLNELYAKYGTFAAESIPWDVRNKVLEDLGLPEEARSNEERAGENDDVSGTLFNQFWGEFRRFWNNLTSGIGNLGKGASALF